MTLQTSSSDIKTKNYADNGHLFAYLLKNHWTMTLVYLILTFVAIPIVTLLMISLESDYTEVVDFCSPTNYLYAAGAFGMAILTAFFMTRYLQTKKSACFYAGLPTSKLKLFAFNYIVGLLQYVFVAVFAIATLSLIVGFSPMSAHFGEIISAFIKAVINCALYYCTVYSVSTLATVIAGLLASGVALCGLFFFGVPALYFVLLLTLQEFIPDFAFDYYTSNNIIKYLSPAFTIFSENQSAPPASSVIYLLTVAVICVVLSFLLLAKRRNERVEMPLAFKCAEPIVKYYLMVLASLLCGSIFWLISGSDREKFICFAWLLFGLAFGAVITMMLSNAIIQKNAKAMFSGLKGLAVFMVAVIAYCGIFIASGEKISSRAKDHSYTDELIIDFHGLKVSFDDKEDFQNIAQILKGTNDEEVGYYEYDYIDVHYEKFEEGIYHYCVFYYRNGIIVIEKHYSLKNDVYMELFNYLEKTDKLVKAIDDCIYECKSNPAASYVDYYDTNDIYCGYLKGNGAGAHVLEGYKKDIVAKTDVSGVDIIGNIYYHANGISITLPVYDVFENTVSALIDSGSDPLHERVIYFEICKEGDEYESYPELFFESGSRKDIDNILNSIDYNGKIYNDDTYSVILYIIDTEEDIHDLPDNFTHSSDSNDHFFISGQKEYYASRYVQWTVSDKVFKDRFGFDLAAAYVESEA
ncbi:MAG: hypothetical protein J5922_03475 [Clostridia bacterium]|nr:hypothetical protein [Clostridia bacterium]